MSEIAGRIAPHVSATYLERPRGGRGVLMGGASGVSPATVVVLGAGTAGAAAAAISAGMEADVTIVDRDLERLRSIDRLWRGRIRTVMSSSLAIERLVLDADVVIGAVLVPGARTPKLVTEEMVREMRSGSVLVDVSIDQGGCFATAKVTTHDDPVYVLHDVIHYCVGNMPGSVPRTATYALTNATLPYLLALANEGLMTALGEVPGFASGLNVYRGQVTNGPVAKSLGLPYSSGALEL
jgi:alanine dehydrogenase